MNEDRLVSNRHGGANVVPPAYVSPYTTVQSTEPTPQDRRKGFKERSTQAKNKNFVNLEKDQVLRKHVQSHLPFGERTLSTQKIISSQAGRENQEKIAKM